MRWRAHGDFETYSELDLKSVGVSRYARHPSTGIWCLAWALAPHEGVAPEPQIWFPGSAASIPRRLLDHIAGGGIFSAHNVLFELEIWNNVLLRMYPDFPRLEIRQCDCTMARAMARGYPGKLEKLAPALEVGEQKDTAGARIMRKMMKPFAFSNSGEALWHCDVDDLLRNGEYCKQDVRTEIAVDAKLPDLTPYERKIFEVSWRINSRGIYVDVPAVEAAQAILEDELRHLDGRMNLVTGGAVTATSQVEALKNWLRGRGIQVDTLRKSDFDDLQDELVIGDTSRDPAASEAVELRRQASKASTKKLRAMLNCADPDDWRARDQFQVFGAHTGRWAGRLIQLQNLLRSLLPQDAVDWILDTLKLPGAVERIRAAFGPVIAALASCIRGFLTAAPGKVFVAADFSNVEGRVLSWLAYDEDKLRVFREFDAGIGPDPYMITAARILAIVKRQHFSPWDVPKELRQGYGKVPDLALGYAGGVVAFQGMARNYGVMVSDSEAEQIKTAWRAAHPAIASTDRQSPGFWRTAEMAAIRAIKNPGNMQRAGRVGFKLVGENLGLALPSGRVLWYAGAFLEPKAVKYIDKQTGEKKSFEAEEIRFNHQDPFSKKWVIGKTYGGKLVENATQAVAMDLLVQAMFRLEENGYPVVLHAHDENVVEMDEDKADVPEIERLMLASEPWAQEIPLAVKSWTGKRYRKD